MAIPSLILNMSCFFSVLVFACVCEWGAIRLWRDGQTSSELESDDWHVLLEAHFGATILHTHTRTSILAITSQCVGLIAQIHIIERYSQKEAQNEGEGEIVLK